MDHDTLRTIATAVNFGAMFFVIPQLIMRGRLYWPAAALVIAGVGYLNFNAYAVPPSPEKAISYATIITTIVLFGGIVGGHIQHKRLDSRNNLPTTPGAEKSSGVIE